MAAALALWAVAWALGLDRRWWPVTLAVPFTPLALLPAWPLAVAALVTRQRALAVVAGAVAAVHLIAIWPVLPIHGGRDRGTGARLTVVTANAKGRNTTPRKWAADLLELDADVVLVQEYSDSNARAMDREGVGERYPWRYRSIWPFTSESAIFSRYPVSDGDTLDIGQAAVTATIDVDGVAVRLLNVHQGNPRYVRRWTESFADVERYLAGQSGPVIVAGDFNATSYHRPLLDVLDGPLRDAHLDRNRGFAATWPADRRVPAFALIDHVLVSDTIGVRRVDQRRLRGSDHRAVVAELALPSG